MGNFSKRGIVKISNGKYTDKEGNERTRYVTVGDYYSSDAGNKQAVKMYATAFSDEKWLNIYLDEPKTEQPQRDKIAEVTETDQEMQSLMDNIPF